MQQRAHALHGTRTLGGSLRAGWLDAFASTQLVSGLTISTPDSVRTTERLVEQGKDPVSAARTWIATARVAGNWSAERISLVDALLIAASKHFEQLDSKAESVARNLGSASLDAVAEQVVEIDRMTGELRDFALRLRALLEPGTNSTETRDIRLRDAVAALRAGGFAGAVDALG